MDWTLFWNAFSAIGTTTGSLITAIAIIIAIKQYKQPITKKISIMFNFETPITNEGFHKLWANIEVTNIGARPIKIINIALNFGKKQLYILNIQNPELQQLVLPTILNQEENANMHFKLDKLAFELSRHIKNKAINEKKKFSIVVIDSANKRYYYKTKWNAKRIIDTAKKCPS